MLISRWQQSQFVRISSSSSSKPPQILTHCVLVSAKFVKSVGHLFFFFSFQHCTNKILGFLIQVGNCTFLLWLYFYQYRMRYPSICLSFPYPTLLTLPYGNFKQLLPIFLALSEWMKLLISMFVFFFFFLFLVRKLNKYGIICPTFIQYI